MAEADLDVVIRRNAKEQHKSLMDAVKKRRDHFLTLAAKAKDKAARDRHKQAAKDAVEHGTAIAKRLQMSAENAADSYARSMRWAAEQARAGEAEGGEGEGQAEESEGEEVVGKRASRRAPLLPSLPLASAEAQRAKAEASGGVGVGGAACSTTVRSTEKSALWILHQSLFLEFMKTYARFFM